MRTRFAVNPMDDQTDIPPIDFERDKRVFDASALHQALGLTLEEMRPGYARIVATPNAVTRGGVGGGLHGGVLAAIVDIVMLRSLFSIVPRNQRPAGTADLNITYLRPALGARITAESTVLRKGRQIAVSEISIFDGEGRLCARGRTLYALRMRPEP
jgi:uncharacterized protein (TIGR00369 family)